jgi:Protein of unknown function (DUF2799)
MWILMRFLRPKSLAAALSLACVLALLSACTSAPKREDSRCAGIDWWEMGRTDGVAGLTLEKGLAEHAPTCQDSQFPVAKDLYENGRDAGLIDYCAPQQGLAAGHAGATYEGVCPAYLEAEFLAQYKVGQRLHALESEDNELESRIENLLSLLSKTQTGSALRSQIEELKTRRANLDVEISKLESSAQSL